MREGVRLPALVVTIGLLAGCSDPAGAVRRQNADARKASPSPRPSHSGPARKGQPASAWWQAPSGTKTEAGLKVRTGRLRGGRIRMIVLDVASRKRRATVATVRPHGLVVGRFTLAGIKVSKSPQGAYGVGFHYRAR
jgi:hypothetical protein